MDRFYQFLLLSVFGFIFYFYWIVRNPWLAIIILLAAIVVTCFFKPLRRGLGLLILVGITHLAMWLGSRFGFLFWPVDFFFVTLVGFLYLKALSRKQKDLLSWGGPLTKSQLLSIFIINVPAIGILYWYFINHPEIAKSFPLPEMPAAAIPAAVILIAAVNGLREEIYYRGLIQTYSRKYFEPWFIVLFQGMFFGVLHFINAFPQGWLGVFLTAIWGAAIAIQFHVFRSLKLAWLTHSIADAIMFSIILLSR